MSERKGVCGVCVHVCMCIHAYLPVIHMWSQVGVKYLLQFSTSVLRQSLSLVLEFTDFVGQQSQGSACLHSASSGIPMWASVSAATLVPGVGTQGLLFGPEVIFIFEAMSHFLALSLFTYYLINMHILSLEINMAIFISPTYFSLTLQN